MKQLRKMTDIKSFQITIHFGFTAEVIKSNRIATSLFSPLNEVAMFVLSGTYTNQKEKELRNMVADCTGSFQVGK